MNALKEQEKNWIEIEQENKARELAEKHRAINLNKTIPIFLIVLGFIGICISSMSTEKLFLNILAIASGELFGMGCIWLAVNYCNKRQAQTEEE